MSNDRNLLTPGWVQANRNKQTRDKSGRETGITFKELLNRHVHGGKGNQFQGAFNLLGWERFHGEQLRLCFSSWKKVYAGKRERALRWTKRTGKTYPGLDVKPHSQVSLSRSQGITNPALGEMHRARPKLFNAVPRLGSHRGVILPSVLYPWAPSAAVQALPRCQSLPSHVPAASPRVPGAAAPRLPPPGRPAQGWGSLILIDIRAPGPPSAAGREGGPPGPAGRPRSGPQPAVPSAALRRALSPSRCPRSARGGSSGGSAAPAPAPRPPPPARPGARGTARPVPGRRGRAVPCPAPLLRRCRRRAGPKGSGRAERAEPGRAGAAPPAGPCPPPRPRGCSCGLRSSYLLGRDFFFPPFLFFLKLLLFVWEVFVFTKTKTNGSNFFRISEVSKSSTRTQNPAADAHPRWCPHRHSKGNPERAAKARVGIAG